MRIGDRAFGVNGVFVWWPGDWPFFTGTGRVYAHDPECRSGFIFTVWPVADEDSLAGFAEEYHGVHHSPFKVQAYLEPAQALQLSPVERREILGHAMLCVSGTFVSHGSSVGYAAVALDVATHQVQEWAAAMVSASSLDGPVVALDVARTIALSCLAPTERTAG